ncbi:proteasome 26S non-ATPase subunit 12 [Capsaspora owczarzaki ATCC 30864]|uniref:Proteasome 26S non-ATPase subunit 12 n=2 Tax=Capsaspora owczarzaki (strain ATCC 30864) TaxID=595528 RepID=A0A0D2X5M4_CAPO3|nr:proteasome 26S non-ATPase subunit 12 [Capsaspora owczarzaki ATCC 30864]KJE98064.1 proteasome 26S non-ATPase subunit 12 [Capsaspora owczarzaki ATCC 30864]|eukprot:XP_004342698.1 proteasome 26S non-ATPase subunit 12 [Capsaspora owczarzaki ATCC 30864]
MADEERAVKMEEDLSGVVDARLPEIQSLSESGKVNEAVDQLLALEKQTRVACDALSTGRVLVAIVSTLFKAKDLKSLNEQIIFLSKRRGLLKGAIAKMVQEASTYVEQISDMEQKLSLIETLRTVTAGKIYVEIERARLTRTLAQIREAEGKIGEAAEVLQELQVETFGSMDRKEKVDFILEQMRLCLAKQDFIRTQIISKKISPKFFDNPDHQELRIRFNQLMIQVEQHDRDHMATSKLYRGIYATSAVQSDPAQWHAALQAAVLYLILAPFDNEQSDLLHRTQADKRLKQLPQLESLLKLFTTAELINWVDLEATYGAELRNGDVFAATEAGAQRWEDLKKRVIEHNIRVISKYYTRIDAARLAELLNLSVLESEKRLSELVVAKTVWARIDRPSGIVTFKEVKDPAERLNQWSRNIDSLMHLVDKTTHLIVKEEMVHRIAAK